MKLARSGARIMIIFMAAVLMSISISALAEEKAERVIKITAKRFEYTPNEIKIKRGVPVVLEFTSLDRLHGFNCPDLGVRTDINPGKISTVRIVPQKAGTYPFHCDIFCGEGHEGMTGTITVEE